MTCHIKSLNGGVMPFIRSIKQVKAECDIEHDEGVCVF